MKSGMMTCAVIMTLSNFVAEYIDSIFASPEQYSIY